jgi:glycosyltransferase involved in cell wall biosynthesis
MLSVHRLLGTWDKPTVYVALTAFARDMFIEAGLPPDKLVVKPNFVDPDPGAGTGSGDYAVFVGRLSVEKGVQTLLSAWRVAGPQVRLLIIGDGPLASTVAAATRDLPSVTWLGGATLQRSCRSCEKRSSSCFHLNATKHSAAPLSRRSRPQLQ